MASLLELLISQRIITPDQARDASALAEETGAFIGRILVAQGSVEEEFLSRFLADKCTVKPQHTQLSADEKLMNLLPERLTKRYRLVPLEQSDDGVLSLAVSKPLSIGGLDQVKRRLGIPLKLILVSQSDIDSLLDMREPTVAVSKETTREDDETNQGIETFSEPTSVSVSESLSVDDESLPEMMDETEEESDAAPDMDTGQSFVVRDTPVSRLPRPQDWLPDQCTDTLPNGLRKAYNSIEEIITGDGRRFIALLGSDGSRDFVLRNIYWNNWSDEGGSYVDLVQHEYPLTLGEKFPSVIIIDGMDHVTDTDSEEQARLLRDIGRAYSSSTPLIVGLSSAPKEVESLSSGLKLTLGLARVVSISPDEVESKFAAFDAEFSELISKTTTWSENAFPGAGLGSLMGAIHEAYLKGNRKEALAKGCASVARRLNHLSDTQ